MRVLKLALLGQFFPSVPGSKYYAVTSKNSQLEDAKIFFSKFDFFFHIIDSYLHRIFLFIPFRLEM